MYHGDTENTEFHGEKEKKELLKALSRYPPCHSVPSVAPW